MAVLSPTPPSVSRPPRVRSLLSPLHLWHLLSLDAPTIATLWTCFIASSLHLRLPVITPVSMFFAVWLLYAADRLLDAQPLLSNPLQYHLEDRHRFHHLHRTWFLAGIALVSLALALLLPRIPSEALHLYLILATLLVGYFITIHATPAAPRLPKELAVGLFFSAAIFIPTVSRRPDLRLSLLPATLIFAIVCSLNCLFIYAWEHPQPDTAAEAHPATRLALHFLPQLASASLAAALLLSLRLPIRPLAAACAFSIAALLLLHRNRHRLSRLTLRTAADLALLTPILLLFFPL